MNMTDDIQRLEARLAEVEKQLADLQQDRRTERSTKEPWWERAGRFQSDPAAYEEFLEILQENRRKDYEAANAEADAAEAAEAAEAAREAANGIAANPKTKREAG
jgi:hypothetical protein